MLFQISSGRGPIECELAVGLYLAWFLKRNPQAVTRDARRADAVDADGRTLTPYKSVLLEIPSGEFPAEGVVQWICPSPVRKEHRRKNWFIRIAAVTAAGVPEKYSALGLDPARPDKRLLRTETFRSPGKGGQNVNKVESGVRITHLPTGLTAFSVTARTQAANRKLALERLRAMISEHNERREGTMESMKWRTHNVLQRGNAVAVFTGLDFVPAGSEESAKTEER
jgi:peptide chain release factor